MATEWDPKRYHDTYTEELKSLIEAKAEGKEIVVEEEAPADSNVLDLMQALEASLEAARKGGGKKMASEVAKVAEQLAEEAAGDDDPEPKSRAKKAPAKKSATKKSATTKTATKRAPAKAGGRKSA